MDFHLTLARRGARAWTGETNGPRGEKNLRPAGGGSVLTESGGEGGVGGWTPHGGRAEEREGERGGPGRGVEQCGGASSVRQRPDRQRLGVAQ
jgi:hypothetical protein